MIGAIITVLFVVAVLYLAYRRLPLFSFTIAFTVLLIAYSVLGSPPPARGRDCCGCCWSAFWLLNLRPLRIALISRPFMRAYRRLLPSMSDTERDALEAGTVWWEGELFTGNPDWRKLHAAAAAAPVGRGAGLSRRPVRDAVRACSMTSTSRTGAATCRREVWEFIKSHGFFAMIIPKRYGGLEFSTYAHSCVLVKLAGRSVTCASTVAVPNSLGPAELLVHYGTEEQKNHYLPRLARGEEIPCFALDRAARRLGRRLHPRHRRRVPRPVAGRARCIGLKLNFSKRYITLAPVATVVGLAFRMFDPEHLLGDEVDIGITCALIPRDTPGIEIGRRHLPLNIPFQNGPIQGHDVFVPLDCIIGGAEDGGLGLAHAGRAAVGRPLHLAARQRHRRRAWRPSSRPAPTRASAGSSIRRSVASKASSRSSRAWSA